MYATDAPEVGTQRMVATYWCEQAEPEEPPLYDGGKYVRSTGRYFSLPGQRSHAPPAHPSKQARQAEIYQAQTAKPSVQGPVTLRSVVGSKSNKLSRHYAAEKPSWRMPPTSKSEDQTAMWAARHQVGSTTRDITLEDRIDEPVPQIF